MSEAVDWSWLRTSIPVVDMAMYLDMPEDIARTVEIRDGMIVHCESPSPNHVAISDNIKGALREAVAKTPGDAPCLRASGELGTLVSEVPFHYKRPDAIVYRGIDEPRGKWRTKPTASDTLLVVEVVSPNTVTADLVEKRAEYARLGIPYYWIVRMVQADGPAASIETSRLTADGIYVLERMSLRARGDETAIDAVDPLTVTISWNQLDLGLD
ncbi:Uma2 family endonuclease [Nocardia otitidiscaviarum]|uniref:Uma2 family endonuclease n=1 Tax=Nocardia otitidiscaviarum TaxID=1823 RepID=UPI0009DDC5FA|nr:Uma2 family endonuclease [Nocardia otitidiscaviarum]MBF6132723.1 Uma2 family endonuclease [Nocardia otitidiscaviarum]MBF6486142.1 Uma2 family endonuclease [Nocardia otitidiscaviarum]